jgi:hypothetical protein
VKTIISQFPSNGLALIEQANYSQKNRFWKVIPGNKHAAETSEAKTTQLQGPEMQTAAIGRRLHLDIALRQSNRPCLAPRKTDQAGQARAE